MEQIMEQLKVDYEVEKAKLNLEPIYEFLILETPLSNVTKELDAACYQYAMMTMKLSELENEPVGDRWIEDLYFLNRLKDIFSEIEKQSSLNG